MVQVCQGSFCTSCEFSDKYGWLTRRVENVFPLFHGRIVDGEVERQCVEHEQIALIAFNFWLSESFFVDRRHRCHSVPLAD